MENLILKSFLDYPERMEVFLEDISLKSFDPFHQKIINALLEMKNNEQVIRLETIRLKLGEKAFESQAFQEILEADSYPDYLDLKSDFKTHLYLKKQESLAKELLEATRKSEVFDYEFLDKYVGLIPTRQRGKYFFEWEEFFQNQPAIEKIPTGLRFLDDLTEGGFEVGQMVLLSGDPEAGKTLLGVQVLVQAMQTSKVTYFGFEFSVRKHMETLKKQGFQIHGRNYFIDDQSYEMNDLIAQIRSLTKEGHKLFLIDSQMKIQAPLLRTAEEAETIKFTSLSELARRLQVVILFIIQNSKTDNYTPSGSRKGGHEAHVMIRLERLKNYDMPNLKEWSERVKHRKIIILKNKQTGLQGSQYLRISGYRFFETTKAKEEDPTALLF
ncbi:RAD55 family ATPase [Helicobacter acinonychis]|uniref:KaiC-like domain-containing protein n=1 Tax=Helicobacter acinonychis (strain Sheeba) TaxID=382638 RepID=Q17VK6_HELAH|nr:ATPase domain-containing protein [Helicobacter acinonychis]CAK00320.1 CUP0976-like hypothetical protein [Helicobacter acinonychis str. Sheeba]